MDDRSSRVVIQGEFCNLLCFFSDVRANEGNLFGAVRWMFIVYVDVRSLCLEEIELPSPCILYIMVESKQSKDKSQKEMTCAFVF